MLLFDLYKHAFPHVIYAFLRGPPIGFNHSSEYPSYNIIHSSEDPSYIIHSREY